jgi:hypothetical protein
MLSWRPQRPALLKSMATLNREGDEVAGEPPLVRPCRPHLSPSVARVAERASCGRCRRCRRASPGSDESWRRGPSGKAIGVLPVFQPNDRKERFRPRVELPLILSVEDLATQATGDLTAEQDPDLASLHPALESPRTPRMLEPSSLSHRVLRPELHTRLLQLGGPRRPPSSRKLQLKVHGISRRGSRWGGAVLLLVSTASFNGGPRRFWLRNDPSPTGTPPPPYFPREVREFQQCCFCQRTAD